MATIAYAPYPATQAVKRAKSYVGQRKFSGMCQAFTVTMFGTGAVGDYDRDRDADAVDGWKAAVAHGKVVRASSISDYSRIPAGVMLYWSGGSQGYGHAAVSIGGGRMVTTDYSNGKIGIATIKGWWGRTHTFLGYVLVEGNGHTLTDPPAYKIVKLSAPKPLWVGASVLLGRRAPVTGAVKVTRKRGFKVWAHAYADVGGTRWYRTRFGTWYSGAYLRTVAQPEIVEPTHPPVTGPVKSARVFTLCWNVAGYNDYGIRTWKVRVAKVAAVILAKWPDIVLTQELSNNANARMLPRLTLLIETKYRRGGAGVSGKWAFWRRSTIRGVKTVKKTLAARLRGDAKQAVAVIYRKNGVLGMDVTYQLEYRSEKRVAGANRMRVRQINEIEAWARSIAAKHGVPLRNVALIGDSNSTSAVRDRLTVLGWYTPVTPATFTGWNRNPDDDKTIDLVSVRADHKAAIDVTVTVVASPSKSDHARLDVRRNILA